MTLDEIRRILNYADRRVIDRLVDEMGPEAALRILTGPPAEPIKRRRTPEERAAAVALMAEVGPREASRRTGIAWGSIRWWALEASTDGPVDERIIR